MKLLELLREYATAQDNWKEAAAATVSTPGEEANRVHAVAAVALARVESAFEDELNYLVDRRVQAALANLRTDAWY